MEAGLNLGKKTEEVVVTITTGTRAQRGIAEFLVPPRIVDEFLSFFDNKEQPFIKEFLSIITVKSPQIHRIDFPAAIFYEIIDDIRGRSYRGMTVAEEEIQKAARLMAGKIELSKKDFEMTVGPAVKAFRDRYRQATRFGFIDSLADLDLIALAKEQDAALVSADEGVIKWGRMFGVREISLSAFGNLFKK